MSETSNHLRRLIDPAVVLAVITSVLYFWGHVYFTAYCQQLGGSFAGLDVPLPQYLLVGWDKIFYVAMGLSLLLCYIEPVAWLFGLIAKVTLGPLVKRFPRFFKKISEATWLDELPEGKLYRLGLLFFVAIMISFYGSKDLLEKGKAYADKALEEAQLVVVEDMNHQPINGPYIYLGNFNGDLMVGEQVEGQAKPNIRIFKDGSYSSYTLRQVQELKSEVSH